MTDPAPYFAEVTQGALSAQAVWVRAEDGVRLRLGVWTESGASKGTVFLCPGRTEYIEKYAQIAEDFVAHGLASIAIDWRGQGLADRLTADPLSGHVGRFTDYQKDVVAMVDVAIEQDLPKPWFLLGHSMGGCIGLRTVMDRTEFTACAFSGPMWGIAMHTALRPGAWVLSWLLPRLGLGHRYAPTTGPASYILSEPFETNGLTRDPAMYQMMRDQLTAHPDLQLGGASIHWLGEALREMRALSARPSPDMPCFTFYGDQEAIVTIPAITDRMSRWPGGTLHMEPGGRHELLMEDTPLRQNLTTKTARLFLSAT